MREDEGADVAEVSSWCDLGIFLLRWDTSDGNTGLKSYHEWLVCAELGTGKNN